MFNQILLPTDGSRFSEKAVETGLSLAKTIGAQVTTFTASLPFNVLTTDAMSLSNTKDTYLVDAGKRADATFFVRGADNQIKFRMRKSQRGETYKTIHDYKIGINVVEFTLDLLTIGEK